jgi:hypothetical protein
MRVVIRQVQTFNSVTNHGTTNTLTNDKLRYSLRDRSWDFIETIILTRWVFVL